MFSRFFIGRPIFASVLSIVIVLGGSIALFTLPVAQYPDITPPTVEVSAAYPGANATTVLCELVRRSRFAPQLHLVLLQGIALAGFNVVDLPALHEALDVPVISVVRRRPDMAKVRRALLERVPGGGRKWRLIEKAGPVEPLAGLFGQRAGIGADDAGRVLKRLALSGNMPEPLRTAHLIAAGIALGESRHRV